MSRRELRENIFKILFREQFHAKEELDEQLKLGVENIEDSSEDDAEDIIAKLEGISDEDREYIQNKLANISAHLEEIDALINEKAEKWKTSRMAKAELTIIRLAVYEMKYEEDIPVSVSINEAVELAKVYGAENGAGFVNGVLAKLA